MNKEEQLKIYSAYLPFKLEVGLSDEGKYNLDSEYPNEHAHKTGVITEFTISNGEFGYGEFKVSEKYYFSFNELSEVKPVLYDLSYLTKEIEHEGDRFVPMIKLMELQETNHFSKNPIIKNANSFNHEKVIDCKSKTFKMHPDEMTEHKVRYLVETSNMGTLIYSLTYDEHFDRFYMADESRNVILGVGYQRQMFEKLYEWKLNVFALPEGEYINKSTLTQKQ